MTVAMPVTADKCYNNAAIEPNNPSHVIDERSSHDALESPVGQALGVVIGQ
ncbi:hypothetical protein H6G64_36375 [Calothrix sp. FACHB-156]|nr:hypothetical protein [Calothrix sp. FACHB-156]